MCSRVSTRLICWRNLSRRKESKPSRKSDRLPARHNQRRLLLPRSRLPRSLSSFLSMVFLSFVPHVSFFLVFFSVLLCLSQVGGKKKTEAWHAPRQETLFLCLLVVLLSLSGFLTSPPLSSLVVMTFSCEFEPLRPLALGHTEVYSSLDRHNLLSLSKLFKSALFIVSFYLLLAI